MMKTDLVRLQILECIEQILYKNQNLEDIFDRTFQSFPPKDRAFARMLIATCLKRLGQIDGVLNHFLQKPLPFNARRILSILRIGVAQILFMDTPDHASVSTCVDLAKTTENGAYTKLVNAVLRNLLKNSPKLLPEEKNIPDWIYEKLENQYGKKTAHQIAKSFLDTPAIDIVVKENPKLWAEKLNAEIISGHCLRLPKGCFIPTLDGFDEGAWWVQDYSAYLATEVLDNIKGLSVADFCSAPGGKTASLIMKGGIVDAFDISANRMKRLNENLTRIHLKAQTFVKNANDIEGENKYDIILLDAPCSATGTLRRHPDVLLHRKPTDLIQLIKAQEKLLNTAHRLVKQGGKVVYCTCSLLKDEGEEQIEKVKNLFHIIPLTTPENYTTEHGFLRPMPFHGHDGFFIALLEKK